MKLLLDTAPFLWFISGDVRLPDAVRDLIRDPDHDVWLSVISLWEVVIKQETGRLPLPQPARAYVPVMRERHGLTSLALEEAAVTHLSKLPSLHRDPFDRMLVCQAIEHDLVLVTSDEQIRQYPVKTTWPAR